MAKDKYDIFLSYIRDDSGGWTAFLHRSLSDALLPGKSVFKDDVETEYGEKWAPRLSRLVRNCEFFLLVITSEWSKSRIQSRLEDEHSWVRKEIITALDSGKTIIPLLMDGAKLPTDLPEKLKPAIEELQCFSFSKGSEKWGSEIKRLCKQITNTDTSTGERVTLTRRFAKLDRVKESSCVRDVAEQGKHVIAVCADTKDSPLVFAQRCGLELDKHVNESGNFQEAIELDWMQFVENISEPQRRKDLLQAVARSSGVDTTKDSLEKRLRQHFKKNKETLLFHCSIPNSNRAIPERMNEWLAIWNDLLRDCPAKNILAILFFPRALLFTRRPELSPQASKTEAQLLRDGLGKIELDHATTFIHKLNQAGFIDQGGQKEMRRACNKIFYLTFGCRFQKVMDTFDLILRG